MNRSLLLLPLLVLGLVTSNFAFAEPNDLRPRHVSKNGDVEVPAGMHMMTDHTGLRWLLPDGMDVPPEKEIVISYFKATSAPTVKRTLKGQTVLSGPLSSQDTVISRSQTDATSLMKKITPEFAETMRLEKEANLHAQTSIDLQSLGDFGPGEFTTFKLPFIPIPKSEMEFAEVSSYASAATKKLVEFRGEDGVEYVRFFILPNYVESYSELIAKHGIVYDKYIAMTTSSPRSLIAIDPKNPDEVHWIKPSLHKKLDGSVRINTDKKARRAIIMSEAIHSVPKAAMDKYHVRFMLEPAAFQPKGKLSATIHREVAPELSHPDPGTRWIPAFILQNAGADAVPGMNIQDMARVAHMPVVDFVREKVVRPLLYSYLSMGFVEGLPGELHTQNFYYQLKKVPGGWAPTGQMLFKDNDGFRFDTELAIRQGRPLEEFARFDDPFGWGKFSNAIGLGAEGVPFLASWYYKLIRNVSGFNTLAAYMLRVINQIDPAAGMTKESMQKFIDSIAAEEATKITGIQITGEDFGFAADKGLSKVLGDWRTKLSLEADISQKDNVALQKVLGTEWNRLVAEHRHSAQRRSSTTPYFLLHKMIDGAFVIEARTTKPTAAKPDPTVGFAMVEAASSQEGRAAHARLERAAAGFNLQINVPVQFGRAKAQPVRSCNALFASAA